MKNRKIGFIGKASISASEARKLVLMGKYIARTGRVVQLVPAQGSTEAIRSGVLSGGGELTPLEREVIGASDHTFVYADDRLFTRLQSINPNIKDNTKVTLIFSEIELDLWLKSLQDLFESQGIQPPV